MMLYKLDKNNVFTGDSREVSEYETWGQYETNVEPPLVAEGENAVFNGVEWIVATEYPAPMIIPVSVPQFIMKWQAELILLDMGILPAVQMAISADPAMSIVYQGVTTFERSNGLITQVALAQNIPDDVIDKMFLAANRYTTEMATDQAAREEVMREVGLTQ
jgi:hypothetical protein